MISKLEELEEELYGKEGEKKAGERLKRRITFPGILRRPRGGWLPGPAPKIEESKWGRTIFKIFLGGVLLAVIIGSGFFLFFYLGSKGQEAKITIEGPERITGGDAVTIPIVIKNLSGAKLNEAEVSIILPEGTLIREEGQDKPAPPRISIKLEDLAGGEERIIQIQARMFGKEGEGKKVEAVFLYRPENLRARFSAKETKVFIIGQVPLAASWDLPAILNRNQMVEAKIHYSSQNAHLFEDLSLLVEYPPGFIFQSADPQPETGETVWNIGKLEFGDEGEIIIRGTISGVEGEIKSFRAGIGVFNALTKEWKPYTESLAEAKIAVTPLAVEGFWKGSKTGIIHPGEKLDFTIKYKNNTDFTFKNVSVRVFLEAKPGDILSGQLLDFTSLSIAGGGVFDSASGAIVWGPGGSEALRELKPGDTGEFTFLINTRSRPAIRNLVDKNFVVRLRSNIEAAGVPRELVGTDVRSKETFELKVGSKVLFVGRSLHRSSTIINSGPLPPRVGEKTTYTVLWEVRNFTNDLENAEIKASLPPNIKWENVISPQDAKITFNSVSGEVRWNIGKLKAGTGVLSPALLSEFKLSIIPSIADAGETVLLLSASRLEAKDTFTGEDVGLDIGPLSTELRDDRLSNNNEWKVVR